ncbi:sel1 repeat family protein [Streptomyces sp. NBC_00638]|uniref:tetratricopeptide repeat protein n=1 Tax=Streptomyces sp. NBC_00638 TaxID=2975794 RepID=UPI0022529B21|nr:tetratricopeptide repeat protein [Streptomyces sp. NBC_00638]MCX5009212.1 sel1 repeat family protein [Streptomyces sp. NBC_00638]
MGKQGNGDNPALTELRKRLADGRALARLNQTQLAVQARLGRTTVSEALSPRKPAPSADTVAVLGRVLKLPVEELLTLQREAARVGESESEGAVELGPGRPIGEWEPHDLEVHPAGPEQSVSGSGGSGTRALPGYVERGHDRVLAEAVEDVAAGRSRIVVLVGTSSTGKTRACWEAVQPLAEKGWRLWHPFDPTRAEAALEDLHRVRPRTVVWLNEAQHYLGDRAAGERIAAAVHRLLVSPERGPVLVLGTLWPEYAHQYTALPDAEAEDPHSRVRELLSGHILTVPDAFDTHALAAAAAAAEGGDRLLADALTRARADGRITQDLAGAPELLTRYQQASPAATALLKAAMDARRLGVGLHLPQAFLTDAATDYLTDVDYDQLTDDWAERAFAELAELVHGKQAPLRRATPRAPRRPPVPSTADAPAPPPAGPVFRLADYLEQHGRTTRRRLCPPDSFWHAAHTRLTHPDDLSNLSQAAGKRHRLQWAHALLHRAADLGSTDVLLHLAEIRKETGDRQGAEHLLRQAADHGSTEALYHQADMRGKAGDREGAVRLLRQAADHGSIHALTRLTLAREGNGDREGANALALKAAGHGSTSLLHFLAVKRKEAGDREGAERLLRQAADHGNAEALRQLALMREEAGDREGAETLALKAQDHGDISALYHLALMRKATGDGEGAETLALQAEDHGNTIAPSHLAVKQEDADREAERLLRQAADHGSTDALYRLSDMRGKAGDREGAERLLRQAADQGNAEALYQLALVREEAGDWEGAETLALKAADHGNAEAPYELALMREEAGDGEGAGRLIRQAADHGSADPLGILETLWPDGLDPDGTPTPPWQPSEYAPLDRHVPPGTP